MEEVRTIADPLRLQMIIQMAEPKTAKQLAVALGVPVTRLYYHLSRLEEHKLVKVVRRRQVSGIEEKTYQAAANNFQLAAKLWASKSTSAEAMSALVDVVRTELAVAAGSDDRSQLGHTDSSIPIFTLTRLSLTQAQVHDLVDRLNLIVDEYACIDSVPPDGTELFHFFVAGYRPPAHPDNAPRV